VGWPIDRSSTVIKKISPKIYGSLCVHQSTAFVDTNMASDEINTRTSSVSWPGSSVGITTGYRLDGPGIESRWGEIPHLSRPALRPTQPLVQWVPGLSWGVESGRGVTLTPHALLVRRSKSRVEICGLEKG
jgi:hypothetical protein